MSASYSHPNPLVKPHPDRAQKIDKEKSPLPEGRGRRGLRAVGVYRGDGGWPQRSGVLVKKNRQGNRLMALQVNSVEEDERVL